MIKSVVALTLLIATIVTINFVMLYQHNHNVPYTKMICLDGHIYYQIIGYQINGIAAKFTDDGKPCRCSDSIEVIKNDK
jgi:hypothetical protein